MLILLYFLINFNSSAEKKYNCNEKIVILEKIISDYYTIIILQGI